MDGSCLGSERVKCPTRTLADLDQQCISIASAWTVTPRSWRACRIAMLDNIVNLLGNLSFDPTDCFRREPGLVGQFRLVEAGSGTSRPQKARMEEIRTNTAHDRDRQATDRPTVARRGQPDSVGRVA